MSRRHSGKRHITTVEEYVNGKWVRVPIACGSCTEEFLSYRCKKTDCAVNREFQSGKQFGTLATLKKMGMRKGAADLVIGHAGRMYCLEVKSETGKQSDDQLGFEDWCKRCGVPYVVVRSVGEVAYWLKEWGIVPEAKA